MLISLDGKSTAEVLRTLVGRFVILNVTVNGTATSVCVNVQQDGSAAWRRKENNRRLPLALDSPGFSLTTESLLLSFDDVNVLADNFHVIWEAIPEAAIPPDGKFAIGKLNRDGATMGLVLAALEQRSSDIRAVCSALTNSIDTPLFQLRRQLGRSALLMDAESVSPYGRSVLAAFGESQRLYAQLPHLRGFGTSNARGQGRPGKRDALLRWYMQNQPGNPLATNPPVDFVAYELKPLNISDSLTWTCRCDPRTESVDLLLELAGSPALTEVKMRGDKFTSSAIVQLLYYASIMANSGQASRLRREVRDCPGKMWMCVVVEKRLAPGEAGFEDDLQQTLRFLRSAEVHEVVAPFFSGCAVLVIREQDQPFCVTRDIPAFQVVTDGEHFIDWSDANG